MTDAETLRFINHLAETLDVDETCGQLGISKAHARAILKTLVRNVCLWRLIPAKPAGQTPLFKEAPAQKKPVSHRHTHASAHTINVDGASRGNPGLAGAGAVITAPDGTVVKRLKKFLGSVTNNVAEYQALIMALEAATHLKLEEVRIYADSELMVKQINGLYKVKSVDLKPLYDKAMLLIKRLPSVKLSHVMREENSLADAMANEAIDTRDARPHGR